MTTTVTITVDGPTGTDSGPATGLEDAHAGDSVAPPPTEPPGSTDSNVSAHADDGGPAPADLSAGLDVASDTSGAGPAPDFEGVTAGQDADNASGPAPTEDPA